MSKAGRYRLVKHRVSREVYDSRQTDVAIGSQL